MPKGYVHNKKRREDGRWEIRKMVDRKVVVRIKDTEDEADECIMQLRRMAVGVPAPPPVKTLAGIVAEYQRKLASEDAPGDTTDYYERIAKHLQQHLGPNAPPPRTQREIVSYVERRKASGGQGVSILKELSALKTFMRYSGLQVEWQLPKIRVKHRETYCPSDQEIAKVYLSLQRPDAERAFLLALLAGMRTYEVLRSTWEDVDLDRRILTIRAEKTDRNNFVHISDPLLNALKGGGTGMIVPLSKSALRDIMVRRTAGMARPWSGIKYLRHATSTWALEAGYSELAVDGILSHARGGITKRHYDHRLALARAKESQPILEAVAERFVKAITPTVEGVLRFGRETG